MTNGRHQMPAAAGRGVGRQGEALPGAPSDEPGVPRSVQKGAGLELLPQMLTKENRRNRAAVFSITHNFELRA